MRCEVIIPGRVGIGTSRNLDARRGLATLAGFLVAADGTVAGAGFAESFKSFFAAGAAVFVAG